jgi:hypothetical protein
MSNLLDPGTRAVMEARVRRLRPDSPRLWGRMTPHQTVCHLSDAFKISLDEREVAPLQRAFKPLLRFIALRLPLPWPRGRIQTVPEADQGAGGTPPTEFTGDVAELLALIERFAAARPDQRCATHPIFGPMTADLWGRWGFRHLDHHLRQFGI